MLSIEPLRQVAQLGGWRVLHSEQVRDKLAHQGVPADLFRRYGLGLDERGDRLIDLAALSMGAGHVDKHPGLSFGRQAGGVHIGSGTQCATCVTNFDGNGDLIRVRFVSSD